MEKIYIGIVTEDRRGVQFFNVLQKELNQLYKSINEGRFIAENDKIVVNLEI